MSQEDNGRDDNGSLIVDRPPTEERERLKPPPQYAVVMFNDDFTPMDFVVAILTQMFGKSPEEAATIMLDVHEKGKGVAGIYPKDIAETKAFQVNHVAQKSEHPFKCDVEQAN